MHTYWLEFLKIILVYFVSCRILLDMWVSKRGGAEAAILNKLTIKAFINLLGGKHNIFGIEAHFAHDEVFLCLILLAHIRSLVYFGGIEIAGFYGKLFSKTKYYVLFLQTSFFVSQSYVLSYVKHKLTLKKQSQV